MNKEKGKRHIISKTKSMFDVHSTQHPPEDELFSQIADYVLETNITSEEALKTAQYCLIDSLGCAILSLKFPACQKHLGPIVPGATLENGARVPGTDYELDPVQAAFNLGSMIRWLDYNDTWLAAEWGHPSDNLGGILALADYLSRTTHSAFHRKFTVKDILIVAIKAYEIQGILALENSFNRVGMDHVILVRIASTAVATAMLGGSKQQVMNAISNAWIDGGALRTYRHAPNTGSRKSWAAGDATSRAIRLALMAKADEMGYSSALSAKQWGFQAVLFQGNEIRLPQELGSYVMENILFKVSFPAEFHAQTAVEAALILHKQVEHRLEEISEIRIHTQESAVRIIDKTGELNNPADRDHCLQYMVAVPLIFGRLNADDYEDTIACDPRIDRLREKMKVSEDKSYSVDYLDPNKRAIPNAIQIIFNDGSSTEKICVNYPVGHRQRRAEANPLLMKKFENNIATHFDAKQCENILSFLLKIDDPEAVNISDFLQIFVTRNSSV